MNPAQHVAVALIRLYQLTLSRVLGGQCRFTPSCSAYAMEAVRVHGTLRGSWMGFRRILRCNPFHPGGHDPVPPPRSPETPKSSTHGFP